MGTHTELLEFLTSLVQAQEDQQTEPETVALALHSQRQRLLQVLDFKGSNPESARQVESLSVNTPKYGEQRLDEEPDKRLALLLSRELRLDEVLCVEYLITAAEERGSFTAEAAAGLYLEDRQSTVKCLMLLLQDVLQQDLSPQDPPRHPYTLVFRDFVMGLLAEQAPPAAAAALPGGQKGPQALLTRIIDALKDNSLEPMAHSSLIHVRDEAGVPVSRVHLLQLEKRLLCKCLLYALLLQQHVAPQVVASLLDVLGGLSARLKAAGGKDVFVEEQVHLLLLSLSLAMTMPQEGGTQEEANLAAIASNPAVKEKLAPLGLAPPGTMFPAGAPPPLDGLSAVLRLCWGTLLASANTAQHRQEAGKLMVEAQAAGAFSALRTVFENPNLKIDDESHQEAVSTCVYRLVGQALTADRALRGSESSRLDGPLSKALAERCMLVVKRTGGGGVAFAPLALEDPAAQADHNGTVLGLLSAVFGAHPRLWLVADTHDMLRAPIESLIARTVTHDVMKVSPEVRVPFLEMMASLAVGEYGTSLVLRQFAEMARSPSLEVLTWRKLFTAMVEYCVRYNTVLAEVARAGISTGSLSVPVREERLMNTHEANILIAFLTLFKQVVEQGTVAEVQSFLEGLERELGPVLSGFPLTEPMFQLMCHPVPNTVKASLDEVLSSLAHRFKETSGVHLLERLVQCAAVTPAAGPMLPGMPRLDLVTQLNEIEARNEDYPETIAFVRLLNSLIAASLLRNGALSRVGGALVSGSEPADGGLELGHFTGFVVQHVLAHLWQRGYRDPSQKWEVASVAFQHLELMLELAGRSSMPATEPSQKQPPGWAVMHDVLSNGPVMQALLHTLAPGHEDMSAFKANGTQALAAREAAVVAALRVINSLMRLDGRFLADTARTMGMERYLPLHAHLRAGARAVAGVPGGMLGGSGPGGPQRRLLATLLEYICYQDNEEVQVETLKLTLELSLRLPNLVELLQQPASGVTGEEDSTCETLRRGYAVALRQSLFKATAADNLDEPGLQAATGPDAPDIRPALILRLLLQNANLAVVPSFTHLLMGYDVEPSMTGLEDSLLLPRVEYSCLTIFERALLHQNCLLSRTKPKLYSQMLNVLFLLSTTPISSVPILEYLSPKNNALLLSLKAVLSQPLPDPELTYECAAALHQLSWIMRLQALLLLRLEHIESMRTLLSELLKLPGEDADEEGGGMASSLTPIGRYILLQLLHVFSSLKLQEPYLADIPAEERHLQAEMSVDDVSVEALLGHPHVQTALGVHMRSDTGDVLFDVAALYPLLIQRYEQYIARGGQAGPAAAEAPAAAVRGALRYVQHFNAHALLSGAQAAVAEAWMQLTQIVFTRQYDQLSAILPHGPAERLLEVLMASLEVTRQLLTTLPGANSELSPLMVNVARILLSKLQEQAVLNVSMGQSADPLALVRAPHRCHELLRLLLELLALSRRVQPVRVQLYAALLQYLQFCRGSKLSSACSPLVLEAVLQGLGASPSPTQPSNRTTPALTNGLNGSNTLALYGGPASKGGPSAASASATGVVVARLDAAQEAIEQGNAQLVNEQGPVLVDVIARDALDSSAPQLQQAVALHALSALVAVSAASATAAPYSAGATTTSAPGASLASTLYSHNVPQALLAGLAGVPQALLATQARGSRRAVFVIEAQLALLLQLGQSGPSPRVRQLAAQSLSALQPLQHLAGCRALDVEPEDPGSSAGPVGTGRQMDSLRYRLQHLMAPTLRLVLAIVASLPESTAVRHDARLFVSAHYRALDRVLREAASSGNYNWSPSDSELEQAELVTSLLSRLVPVWSELGPTQGEGLRHALFRLALAFCCLDTKSTSPIVKSLHTLSPHPGQASPNRTALVGRALRVASLRAVLARFLRDLVAHHQHHPSPNQGETGASLGNGLGQAGALFRCLGPGPRPEYDPHTARPTLMLIRDMAEQAAVDASAALDELESLLGLLRLPDRTLDDATCAEKLVEYGPPGGAAAVAAMTDTAEEGTASGLGGDNNGGGGLLTRRRLARHYLALAASQLDTLLAKDLFILEHSLAIIVLHFVRYLPRPLSSAQAGSSSAGGAFQSALGGAEELLMDAAAAGLGAGGQQEGGDAAALGSSADLAYFISRLQETCNNGEELVGKVSNLAGGGSGSEAGGSAAVTIEAGGVGALGSRHAHRLEGIELMVRTLKSYCASF